jgi:hypothetical protein
MEARESGRKSGIWWITQIPGSPPAFAGIHPGYVLGARTPAGSSAGLGKALFMKFV